MEFGNYEKKSDDNLFCFVFLIKENVCAYLCKLLHNLLVTNRSVPPIVNCSHILEIFTH